MVDKRYDLKFLQLIDLSHLNPLIRTWVLEILGNNRIQQARSKRERGMASGPKLGFGADYYNTSVLRTYLERKGGKIK